MAYEATAISSSTFKKQVATNAVDADPWTFALTEPEEYPSLTVTLSDIFTIKGIHLILQEGKVYKKRSIYLSIYLVILYHQFFFTDQSTRFSVYIRTSTLAELNDVTLCNFFYATGYKNTRNLICTKTLTGDQIVITTNSTYGRLLVYEIQVYGM